MTVAVPPIRKTLAVLAAALVFTGCATSGQVPTASLASPSPCPERMVLVCEEHSSLLSSCACASRNDFRMLMGRR